MKKQENKHWLALTAVCLSSLMFGLEISSVPVILPTLEKVLHGNFKDMQWVMNAYTIACTTVLMATGTLADRYGRKRIFMISISLFAITSLVCGLSNTVLVLIISRFLQGISAGAMLICQVAILSNQFQDTRTRSKAFGIWGIVFGIGLGFGPIIGGIIVALVSWQWIFLVHVPLSVITLLIAFKGVQESSDPGARKLDITGIITLTLAVLGLTFFITQGPGLGFASMPALSILAVAVLSFAAFVYVEKKSTYPMFDFSVFRIRAFSGAILGSAGMNFSFWPFMIYLPIYFQTVLGYDPVTAGLFLLAYTLPTLVFPPVGEWLSLRYRPGFVIPLGMFTIGLGFMLMKYGSSVAQPGWWDMLPGSLLAGIGLGITNTPVTNTTTASVPAARAGMASGIDMSARLVTLAINIALMGFLLVQGIFSQLQMALPGFGESGTLYQLAERIAAGSFSSSQASAAGVSSHVIHEAMVNGFGVVMLYGGIGAWVLALISYVVFNVRLLIFKK